MIESRTNETKNMQLSEKIVPDSQDYNFHEVSQLIEKVVIQGDLSKLSPQERVFYYKQLCNSLGLNPLSRPFDYITLNGKLTLYVGKGAAEQLRKIHEISIEIGDREAREDVYIVTAKATGKNSRKDESIGAVSVAGLKGDAKANAIMKAETKAKRRVTLSFCGLGMLDESEVSSIQGAKIETMMFENDDNDDLITDVLTKIKNAKGPGELSLVARRAKELPDSQKKVAREAYELRLNELKVTSHDESKQLEGSVAC